MKKSLLFFSILLAVQLTSAQNTPWQTTGNIGIGTTSPLMKLQVNTSNANDGLLISHNFGQGFLRLHGASLDEGAWNPITRSGDAGLIFGYNPTELNFGFVIAPWKSGISGMRMAPTGNVSIGTYAADANSKLLVDGTIRARKVKVDQNTWPDYVFNPSYVLRPLSEVEQFIQKNHHLPDLPSEAEVKKEGLSLGDNQALLLQKIEELTLYVIQQQKEIEALKNKSKL